MGCLVTDRKGDVNPRDTLIGSGTGKEDHLQRRCRPVGGLKGRRKGAEAFAGPFAENDIIFPVQIGVLDITFVEDDVRPVGTLKNAGG